MKIHSTAIIDQKAELADDVEVGPYVLIEGPVHLGPGCVIQAHAVLTGDVRLGADNTVGYGAIIGAPPQDAAYREDVRSGVRIGARNVIREHCTIHRGTAEGTMTEMGDDNYLMAVAHLAHNTHLGNGITVANNSLLAGYVQVGDRAFLGGGSVYHQFMRVGNLVMTQGLSGFGQDIPPFTMGYAVNTVIGLNVVGLRRAGIGPKDRTEIKEAFRLVYRSGLNLVDALAKADERQWGMCASEFFAFIRDAKRQGICPYRKRSHDRTAE